MPLEHQPQRILLIGTTASVRALPAMIDSLGPARPEILGAVVTDREDPSPTCPAGFQHEPAIVGGIADLAQVLRRTAPDAALVSLPMAMTEARAAIRAALSAAQVPERSIPTIADTLSDTAMRIREPASLSSIDFAGLIGRPPRQLDEAPVRRLIEGRRILITGAGGSIGSELARRCASLCPSELFLMERAENALFEIDRQIATQYPALQRRAVLHDIVDAEATLRRFLALRPEIVFHAAAHKHVPMMEDHPSAAVNNNIFGTKSVADAAMAVGVERFILISTDKAVNPSSVMGATKRIAELYVLSLNAGVDHGRFRVVRFGNVLGSACSVLPVWASQIADGGPVTITHPEMTRYFMTIPEAAALVIQAAAIDSINSPATAAANIFVLDMGAPVSIRGLAERFVKCFGLEPVWDHADADQPHRNPNIIRMTITGKRSGEKLHEELAYTAEELQATPVPGILAWSGHMLERSSATRMVAELSLVRDIDDPIPVIEVLQRHVPHLKRGTPGLVHRVQAA